MVLYIAIGLLQGLVHEVLRQAVILRKRLFWWDIPGRIGTYFIYIITAAVLFLLPLYAAAQMAPPLSWEEIVWPWIGGVALGIVLSRIFVKKQD